MIIWPSASEPSAPIEVVGHGLVRAGAGTRPAEVGAVLGVMPGCVCGPSRCPERSAPGARSRIAASQAGFGPRVSGDRRRRG